MSKEKTLEKGFPFCYDGWDEAGGDYGDVQFYHVQFTGDFGGIMKGDCFDCVLVEHSKARLVAMKNDENGNQIGEIVVKWKAVAV